MLEGIKKTPFTDHIFKLNIKFFNIFSFLDVDIVDDLFTSSKSKIQKMIGLCSCLPNLSH